ncbi:MAG: hypothetical protein IKJ77_08680 [Firmicutes bacterium]|nr:hypothetical protein [Bacillota bacterium]
MKKKVLLVLFCTILAATGLAGCSEEKEPVEAVRKTAEKTKTIEPAEDFEDEKKEAGDSSNETETAAETADFEEKEDDTEIQVQPKAEEVSSQEVCEKEKPQKEVAEPKEVTKEKPKQEGQKAETPKEPEETKEPKPEPPRHTHSWEPVYAERQVEKVKLVPWTKCYCCGADMTGNVYHIDEHLLNGDSNVHYGTEYREETYYETEKYISGYSCSCGKTKSN